MPQKRKKGGRAARRRKTRFHGIQWALLAALAGFTLWALYASGDIPQSASPASATPSAVATADTAQTPDAQADATASPTPSAKATPSASTPTPVPTPTPEPTPVTILISAAGDCTLGGDMEGSSEDNFRQMLRNAGDDDYAYCFEKVAPIFEADDLTIVNLEVVLTASSQKSSDKTKLFFMRGDPEYANMLPNAGIEIANIANNHINDFGDSGIADTVERLTYVGVTPVGLGYTYVADVRGVKVGFCSFSIWTTPDDVFRDTIQSMRAQCDVLIVSVHWGSELEYDATKQQTKYGRLAVDLGADLVLGHHPHVVNGIEVYKGVNIVYSLGNFCFGGNKNPKDKDTFIYQHAFTVDHGKIVDSKATVIPCKITSVPDESYNNFQPMPVYGDEAEKILEKIAHYSRKFDEPLDLGLDD